MDLSVYSHSRIFEQPHLGNMQVVGIWSVFWAPIGGPIYYWKKGALIEAIILCIATTPFWAVTGVNSSETVDFLQNASTVIWAIFVLFAPVILMMSYRRRGWDEKASRETGSDW